MRRSGSLAPRALAVVAGAAAVLGAVTAARLETTATAAAWSAAALSAAGALALRVSRDGEPASIPHRAMNDDEPGGGLRPVRTAARRAVLVALAAVGAAVVALAGTVGGAVLARAGPRPPRGTEWRRGVHAVTTAGRRVHVDDVPRGGIATVWPEGAVGDPRSPVLLVTLTATPARPPTVTAWVVDERIIGYSKVCTHAGCSVGLFRTDDDVLYCPCHQAMFDGARGAVPVFGPASRPLPQLPLGTDEDGFLVATADFAVAVGPPSG